MAIFVSSLIKGFGQMEEIARWVDGQGRDWLGVELIAFTHDEDYWERLNRLLPTLTCPLTFHGPYIGVEAASPRGTADYDHMVDSYRRVCGLAAKYGVRHIVFHYTQKGVTEEERFRAQTVSRENIRTVLDIGREFGVEIVVENLPFPASDQPLFDNEEYAGLYRKFPDLAGIIDVGHARLTGLDMEAMLADWGSRIHAYHFHNNDGVRDCHNRLDDGVIDYRALAALYRKYTPDARIVLEYEPHAWVSEDRLAQDIRLVRELYIGAAAGCR